MLREGGILVFFITAPMTGDTLVFKHDLHSICRQPGLQLFLAKLTGNAIEMMINFDVVVDVRPDLLAFGVYIGSGRQGLQSRTVKRFVETPPAAPPSSEIRGC